MNDVIIHGRFFCNKVFSRVRNRKPVWSPRKYYRRYTRFIFKLEEFNRFDWANDPRKFCHRYSLRYFNIRRKNRGWKMNSPLKYKNN